MLITNYGVDCAFSQVIYYHITSKMDFYTVSPRNINIFLVSAEPDILIGYSHISVPIPDNVVIINNTKTSKEFFDGFSNFIYGDKSNTRLLYEYLSKTDKIDDNIRKVVLPICNMADNCGFIYNETSQDIKELYNVLGNDQFIYRFIINPDLTLNKHEQHLVSRSIKEKELIVEQYCNNFLTYDDGIVICRSHYNINDMIVDKILTKYETEVILIALWDYSQDGKIKINMYSQSVLAGKIAERFDGNNFFSKGVFQLDIPKDINDINMWLLEIMKSNKDKVYEDMIVENYNNNQYVNYDQATIDDIFSGIV